MSDREVECDIWIRDRAIIENCIAKSAFITHNHGVAGHTALRSRSEPRADAMEEACRQRRSHNAGDPCVMGTLDVNATECKSELGLRRIIKVGTRRSTVACRWFQSHLDKAMLARDDGEAL